VSSVSRPLPRAFYDRDVTEVARDLIGKCLVHETEAGRTSARIVEVEAYLHASDPASHSFRGRTKRNASMFGDPGLAYVYTIHTHHCVNVVAEEAGRGAAVLIRAVEPVEGVRLMADRRGQVAPRQLTSGPGKLCSALAIDRTLDGWDLTLGQRLWIETLETVTSLPLVSTPRIGIRLAADLPLRFLLEGNPYVSGPKRLR